MTYTNSYFEQKSVRLFGFYVVSDYYWDTSWDGQKIFKLVDKTAVEKFTERLQSRHNFIYAESILMQWVAVKRAKVTAGSVCGFKLKVWNRHYKQTGCFTLDTYKR